MQGWKLRISNIYENMWRSGRLAGAMSIGQFTGTHAQLSVMREKTNVSVLHNAHLLLSMQQVWGGIKYP